MIKVIDKSDRAALRVVLSITRTNNVIITPGCFAASCKNAVITVTQGHNIPAGQYICKDYFLDPCEVQPTQTMPIQSSDARYLGQVPSAPAWQMQMALADLSGQIFSTSYLKALFILYKGQSVTVIRDHEIIFFTLQNITLALTLSVPTTRVLLSGLPVTQHQALKALASKHSTSVNQIILATIKKGIKNETDY